MCRYVLRQPHGSKLAKQAVRKFRRKAKEALKAGKNPDDKFSVPRTG